MLRANLETKKYCAYIRGEAEISNPEGILKWSDNIPIKMGHSKINGTKICKKINM